MATTAGQKFAALCMPIAAVGLAVFTADPSWSPRREHYGSWRETQEKAAAKKAKAKEPVPVPVLVEVPTPAPKLETPPTVAQKDSPAPKPETPKPALPRPEGIEYKVGGLPSARSGLPIKFPAAERLDVTVAVSGAFKVGMNFADPDSVKAALDSAPDALKKDGLLFLVPNLRSPWEAMRDLLNGGSAAGWSRIGIAVSHPENAGLGRVLLVPVPVGPADLPKGTDPMTVKVGPGNSPAFVLNGEECKDAAVLEAKAKALHEDCELMTEAYSVDVERTPWTVDGTSPGTMVGGVVSALDALANAGVRTVRITGVQKPSEEQKTEPDAPKPEPDAPKPEEEKK